ncbi:hypothetical protein ACFHWD_18695 [Clostridium sp. MT-14]|jgi:hypothetical protein|uniref:hypothetical protein n=1 Tax=unclassified Clostridium TaxID=2614128 RepID=UPI00123BB5E7|nr:hypothetical protein [Clostridium sp. HV4-5-A1G]KAA8668994.1 hypothetical protein F3O63_13770 [Clostridium sp. HV4-5-A1G]CAB1249711.1 conserved hypothetical protein [Clostridiaceae bacterium BL-3]
MNGYLQCLIDQYQRKLDKSTGEEKNIYMEILINLNKFKEHIEMTEKPQKPQEKVKTAIDDISDIPIKYIAAGFKGNTSGFAEYLKRLKDEI